jgi:hypothetical protein
LQVSQALGEFVSHKIAVERLILAADPVRGQDNLLRRLECLALIRFDKFCLDPSAFI